MNTRFTYHLALATLLLGANAPHMYSMELPAKAGTNSIVFIDNKGGLTPSLSTQVLDYCKGFVSHQTQKSPFMIPGGVGAILFKAALYEEINLQIARNANHPYTISAHNMDGTKITGMMTILLYTAHVCKFELLYQEARTYLQQHVPFNLWQSNLHNNIRAARGAGDSVFPLTNAEYTELTSSVYGVETAALTAFFDAIASPEKLAKAWTPDTEQVLVSSLDEQSVAVCPAFFLRTTNSQLLQDTWQKYTLEQQRPLILGYNSESNHPLFNRGRVQYTLPQIGHASALVYCLHLNLIGQYHYAEQHQGAIKELMDTSNAYKPHGFPFFTERCLNELFIIAKQYELTAAKNSLLGAYDIYKNSLKQG